MGFGGHRVPGQHGQGANPRVIRFDKAQSLSSTQKRQAMSNMIETGTFTPTVALVGGAGTVPVYSTNSGRYTRIGNQVFVDILLTGDGGDEGAGAAAITIALPFTANASNLSGVFLCGAAQNGTSEYPLGAQIGASESIVTLFYFDTISNRVGFSGDLQNNTTRTIRLQFRYEI